MNLPMTELEDLIQDPKKLHRLVLNHLINRSVFSAGLKPHQVIDMANGNKLNLFSRRGKCDRFIYARQSDSKFDYDTIIRTLSLP